MGDLGVHRQLRHYGPFVEVLVVEPSLGEVSQQLYQFLHRHADHGLRPDAEQVLGALTRL